MRIIAWLSFALTVGCSSSSDTARDNDAPSDTASTVDAHPSADVPPAAVSWSEVRVVYERNCAPCHQGPLSACSGQACFVSSYDEATKPSFSCPGLSIAACNAQRAEAGNMPPGPVVVSAEDVAIMKAFAQNPSSQ